MKATADFKGIFTFFSLVGLLTVFGGVFLLDFVDVRESSFWSEFSQEAMIYYMFFVVLRSVSLLVFSSLDFFFDRDLPPPSFFPMVSIIMPCFNEEKVIANAIESVMTLDYPNYEVLVVDDGSFDFTLGEAKRFESKFRLRVICKENGGKAEALNRGISEAVGEYFVCMDADSVLSKNVLLRAMPYFEKDPDLAAVAGSVLVGNTHNFLTRFQKLEYIIGLNLYKKAQSYLNMVTIVPGPIGVFRKSAVEEIGGYHANTFAEDTDLSMRLLMHGYNIKYCESMTAMTEAPDDFTSLVSQRYRWSRGMVQAIVKNVRWLKPHNFTFRNGLVILYMVTETLIIPTMNFIFAALALTYALEYGMTEVLGPFFLGLTLLDMAISLYAIATENQGASLFFLSMINRLTYGLSLEVMRFFAVIDELFGIPMKWGVLQRKGMGPK